MSSDRCAAKRRPASQVMSPTWLAAAYPSALSFSRMAMAQFVRGKWRLERVRFDLDSDGRGRALYQLTGDGRTFHFLVLAKILPEDQQNDRNFAAAWDITAALCEGEWSLKREALLAQEVPKQERGRVDPNTLVMVRANRSVRLYNHVIDSLAEGRQPDPALLAEVGYIMRTTAFLGNGQSGTRAFEGFPDDHPLRRSHYAQIATAFALREFVYELVDHVARCRSTTSVRLADTCRRYLGLGNSTAAGLIRFLYNHPCLLNGWMENWEGALAEAKARSWPMDGPEVERFLSILDRAHMFFRQAGRPPTGVFQPAPLIADELDLIRSRVLALTSGGRRPDQLALADLCDWTEDSLHPETAEVLNSILLEVCPDIVESYVDRFDIDETADFDASMTVGRLGEILAQRYAWTNGLGDGEALDDRFFWFHSSQAPADARRGYRHRLGEIEHDSALETIRNIVQLRAALAGLDAATTAGSLARQRPDLRFVVARVQSMAERDYGELHENPLGNAYVPFPPLRRILAFYGLEKLESAQPKIVRGVLLQGAPIARDVERGIEGLWPFPLQPETQEQGPDLVGAAPSIAPELCLPQPLPYVTVTEPEITRVAQRSLQASGVNLGTARDVAQTIAHAECVSGSGIDALLDQLGRCAKGSFTLLEAQQDGVHLDVKGAPALPSIAYAIDRALSAINAGGLAMVVIENCVGDALLASQVFSLTRHGMRSFLLRLNGTAPVQLAFADQQVVGEGEVADLGAATSCFEALFGQPFASCGEAVRLEDLSKPNESPDVPKLIVVLARSGGLPLSVPAATPERAGLRVATFADMAGELRRRRGEGIRVAPEKWLALTQSAAELLVPPEREVLLREPGFDPAKKF